MDEEYKLLTAKGNLGFYESCEVTEIYLKNKKNEENINIYTLVVFEEKLYENDKTKPIVNTNFPNNDYDLIIENYHLSLNKVCNNFNKLKNDNKWVSNSKNKLFKHYSQLKRIPKQFIPSAENGSRLSKVLKNNFHNGSYIIEFFEENKSLINQLFETNNKKEKLNKIINKNLPINLYSIQDRIGNFIFQYPITLLQLNSQINDEFNSLKLKFLWHPKIKNIPECLLETESYLDGNCMGATIEMYNKKSEQILKTGNTKFETKIKVWNSTTKLFLYYDVGRVIKSIKMNIEIEETKRRYFKCNKNAPIQIKIFTKDFINTNRKKGYYDIINHSIGLIEKEKLKKELSFKHYIKDSSIEAMKDLRTLIQKNGKNGVYLWDPFLKPKEIFQTLYYSNVSNVPLKAISSVKNKYKILKWKKSIKKCETNNFKLNLEFRAEINEKRSFHDRFLIFPGNIVLFEKPIVYSLGTSINGLGNKYHILQKIRYPEVVLSDFNELWDKLNTEDCLVWKVP
ncbi:VPA1262 family N-terminal domain-containing protein [Methanobrevibacter sp. UBA337]|jgi:hypothetical protein|uniref:VPA1262 family N-terminal domain-containing protein n=1 Tax=Methanobrevibacter sp. UBA337 TaxID=1915480 RepID=UPI0039B956C6